MRQAIALTLAAAFLVSGCGSETGGDVASPTEPEVTANLDCDQWSSGTLDVIAPESLAEARAADMPTSPGEAATSMATAPAFASRFEGADLDEGTPTRFPGSAHPVRFVATAPDGRVVGAIIVEEVLPDVWAGVHVDVCSHDR